MSDNDDARDSELPFFYQYFGNFEVGRAIEALIDAKITEALTLADKLVDMRIAKAINTQKITDAANGVELVGYFKMDTWPNITFVNDATGEETRLAVTFHELSQRRYRIGGYFTRLGGPVFMLLSATPDENGVRE